MTQTEIDPRLDAALRAAQAGDYTALNLLREEARQINRVSRMATKTNFRMVAQPEPKRPAGMRKSEP